MSSFLTNYCAQVIMNTESFFELVALFAFRVILGMHGKKISQMKVKSDIKT